MKALFGNTTCWSYCGQLQTCKDADKSSDAAFKYATRACRRDADGNLTCANMRGDKLQHPRFDQWTVAQQQAAPVPDE